jgi:hypothetical protein
MRAAVGVAKLVGRGEQVRLFDGQRSLEAEVVWSIDASGNARPPLSVIASSLRVVGPPSAVVNLSLSEQLAIATAMSASLSQQGTPCSIED